MKTYPIGNLWKVPRYPASGRWTSCRRVPTSWSKEIGHFGVDKLHRWRVDIYPDLSNQSLKIHVNNF